MQERQIFNERKNKQTINIPDLGCSSVLGLFTPDLKKDEEEEQLALKRKKKKPQQKIRR